MAGSRNAGKDLCVCWLVGADEIAKALNDGQTASVLRGTCGDPG
jgi:hypothetical protein